MFITTLIILLSLILLKILVNRFDYKFVKNDSRSLSNKISIVISFLLLFVYFLHKSTSNQIVENENLIFFGFYVVVGFVISCWIYFVLNVFLTAIDDYPVFLLRSLLRRYIKFTVLITMCCSIFSITNFLFL